MSAQPINWSVYIILSANNSLYTGITNDMNNRWRKHRCAKGAKFFRGNRPLALCYQEPNHTRQTASQREYCIKQLSRADKWQLILANYGPNL
jgi:putative endonuclease